MTRCLDSDAVRNAHESEAFIRSITDKRERALVRFLSGQAIFAVGIEGAKEPATPIDLLYVAQIGRMMYQKRKLLDGILNGNPEDYLWGEEEG
jgi:hypothetical protein